jgi:hypothetical protein
MLFGSHLRMRSQKMMERVQKSQNMLFVVTRLADTYIVNNHVSDFFGPVLLVHKVAGECGSGDLGQVLVFGDGEHLLLSQAAKSYTVL